MKRIILGQRFIGKNDEVFIIAEVGCNHNNDLATAKKLIDVAKNAGCDMVKFQLFRANRLYTPRSEEYEVVKSKEMSYQMLEELATYCEKRRFLWTATVTDEETTNELLNFRPLAVKIASYDITNNLLLRHVASKGLPIFLSTGAATIGEIENAVNIIKEEGNEQIIINHCVASYPTPLENANIKNITTLTNVFPENPIGYSDHTTHPTKAPEMAVTLGAKVIEKHITLNKEQLGTDHNISLEPLDLKRMVEKIRLTERSIRSGRIPILDEKIIGTSKRTIQEKEQPLKQQANRGLFAIKDINPGDNINQENTYPLRPGKGHTGLHTKYLQIFQARNYKYIRKIKAGEEITWEDLLTK